MNSRRAGITMVIYGSAAGLTSTNNAMFGQSTLTDKDAVELNDWFGQVLAAADFNADGYDDLAIGAPQEDWSSRSFLVQKAAGVVEILYGTANGLTSANRQLWHQDSLFIADKVESGDQFGATLATGDFNLDGFADLAIGVPREDLDSLTDAGVVHVLHGSAAGISATGSQVWHQNVTGMIEEAESAEFFGSVLATGDFTKDGRDDLVVGVPVESFLTALDGIVHLINGGPDGLTAVGNRLYRPDMPGTGATQQGAQFFGQRFFVGDFDGNGQVDLGIGIPFKNVNGIMAAGAVLVVYHNGLAFSAHLWHQGMPGFLELPEELDQFGY